jgi:hypothetical protein
MIEDLRLHDYADRNVEAYVSAAARLAQFHHTPPLGPRVPPDRDARR